MPFHPAPRPLPPTKLSPAAEIWKMSVSGGVWIAPSGLRGFISPSPWFRVTPCAERVKHIGGRSDALVASVQAGIDPRRVLDRAREALWPSGGLERAT